MTNEAPFHDFHMVVLYKDNWFKTICKKWDKVASFDTELNSEAVVFAKGVGQGNYHRDGDERTPLYQATVEQLYDAILQDDPSAVAKYIDKLWLLDREPGKFDGLYTKLRSAGLLGGRFVPEGFFGITSKASQPAVNKILKQDEYKTHWICSQ